MTLKEWCLEEQKKYKNYRWLRPMGQVILGHYKHAFQFLSDKLLDSEITISHNKKSAILPSGDKFSSFTES